MLIPEKFASGQENTFLICIPLYPVSLHLQQTRFIQMVREPLFLVFAMCCFFLYFSLHTYIYFFILRLSKHRRVSRISAQVGIYAYARKDREMYYVTNLYSRRRGKIRKSVI